ncbi:LysR family transcriptional regulator [Polymorphobacter fuscus]|uniref:LysR family transcriptional regulator n=1 Tax=Sandarakinorhabdus fusca TaxID=1439888 RepID=A0A7C9GXG1_9SPHN|nr:LysR family transcriptional regulator [Polymorphobacter fuscus]KAB7647930.1 LysR family transcriptional regulator [Polymorphobacter fuscus]MQT17254.1 LysR family transcriptional regulator [Polymorphobacter fuscus]NJC08751.1 DNA-binding transcriptional LysR family regulator [Polymorphobacter fuscus]
MNLRQIEIFHAVYLHGSVSAAARALNVSQPAVTKVLRHAERAIGLPLFERTKGRLIPTVDAHTLFTEVADIHDRVRSLRQACHNMRQGRGALLRISALPSLGLGAIPAAVAEFLRDHSDILFDLQTLHHDEMVRKLYDRETDIAIGFEVPPSAPVAHQVIGEGELVVLYPEAAMPDAPPRLHLDALRGHRFISPVQAGPIGRMLSAELNRLDVELDEVVSARTYYVAAALVRAGVGMAIVDNFTANAAVAAGLSSRPLQPAITFDIHAVYLQNRPPSKTASEFLARLAQVIENL